MMPTIPRRDVLRLLGLTAVGACFRDDVDPTALDPRMSWPAGEGVPVSGLAAFAPQQAILFDGGVSPESTYAIALTNNGFLIDFGNPLGDCPPPDGSPSGVVAVTASMGVYQPALAGEHLLPAVPPFAGVVPPELLGLTSDCELLVQLAALDAYLVPACDLAQERVAKLEECRDRAAAAYCRIIELSQHLHEACIFSAAPLSGDSLPADAVPGAQFLCAKGVLALKQIPVVLDLLAARLLVCEQNLAKLFDIEQLFRDAEGAICHKDALLGSALFHRSRAEAMLNVGKSDLATLDILKTHLTPQALQAECAACGGVSVDVTLQLSGAVVMLTGRTAIGRYVGAFRAAADESRDEREAARLGDLAKRLASVPAGRVIQVIFPANAAVPQDHIAVRPASAPDDGVSPLVVILSAQGRGAPLPQQELSDLQFLFDKFRLFLATLRGERHESDDPGGARPTARLS